MFLQDAGVDVLAPVPSLGQQPPVLHLGQNLAVKSVPRVEPLQGLSDLALNHIIISGYHEPNISTNDEKGNSLFQKVDLTTI